MYTIATSQHSESHISRKQSIIGDVGLAPSCSSLLEFLRCDVGTILQWTSFRERLKWTTTAGGA
jgi:hypothetical protein